MKLQRSLGRRDAWALRQMSPGMPWRSRVRDWATSRQQEEVCKGRIKSKRQESSHKLCDKISLAKQQDRGLGFIEWDHHNVQGFWSVS